MEPSPTRRPLSLLTAAALAAAGLGLAPTGAAASCVPTPPDRVDLPCRDTRMGTEVPLRLDRPAIRPGGRLTVAFQLSAPARVAVEVLRVGAPDAAPGAVVRTLLTERSRKAGPETVSWNGRDAAGRAVADGGYTVRVRTAGGPQSGAEADLIVDATAPVLRASRPRRADAALVVTVRERVSGLARATVRVDGRVVGRLGPGQRRLAHRPRGGWSRGAHRVVVEGRDRAGNRSRLVRRLQID